MLLALCYLVLISAVCVLILAKRRFDAARNSIAHRIHVNGIRGKSTITRYTAAVLRDAGYRTFGKTTGTAARVIMPDGSDAIIKRKGFANVNEQLRMIRSFAVRKAEAIVMECMAINPDYQEWLEDKVMRSHIVIISNVRLDHQEEMGKELTDIARSLARSIPTRATLITAERRPELLEILRQECQRKHSRLIQAPIDQVRDADLARFGHMAHKDNVAIGLAVARMFGIGRQRALAAMAAAPADPGAFQVEDVSFAGKRLKWANLFAVNDKESFAMIARDLVRSYPDHYRVALLNNRHDRPSRVEMFGELAQEDLRTDAVVALGDYEDRVLRSITKPQVKTAAYGNTSPYALADGRKLLRKILSLSDRREVLVVGTVNIHTQQSEQLLETFDSLTGQAGSTGTPVYTPGRVKRQFFRLPAGLPVWPRLKGEPERAA